MYDSCGQDPQLFRFADRYDMTKLGLTTWQTNPNIPHRTGMYGTLKCSTSYRLREIYSGVEEGVQGTAGTGIVGTFCLCVWPQRQAALLRGIFINIYDILDQLSIDGMQ